MLDHLLRTDFKAVDKRDPVSALFGYLRGEVATVPIVLDGKRPYGVVNEKRIARAHLDPRQHIDRYVVGPGVVTPDASVEEALSLCAAEWVPHVPVWDGRKLLGYVRAIDLLKETGSRLPASSLLVEAPPLRRDTSVGDALHTLCTCASHVLAVLDARGRIAGVVDRRTLLPLATDTLRGGRKGAGGEVADPRASTVEGYVDGRFETVRPETSFADVCETLDGFGAAFVVAGERVRGVVTPESAAKAVQGTAREVELPLPGRRSEGMPGS